MDCIYEYWLGGFDANLSHFAHYEGRHDCGLKQLYQTSSSLHFCSSRADLLTAMSSGGRAGFDAVYMPQNCQYRWYSSAEICFILERFDALLFIGDDLVRQLYAAFNILLREDLATGALQPEAPADEREHCHCNAQFVRPKCREHFVARHEDMQDKKGSSYVCNRG